MSRGADVEKAVTFLGSVCGCAPFNSYPKEYPKINFGEELSGGCGSFLRKVACFEDDPSNENPLECKLAYVRIFEDFKLLEQENQVQVLRDLSEQLRLVSSDAVALKRCELNLFCELFMTMLKEKPEWLSDPSSVELFWETASLFFTPDPLLECDFMSLLLIQRTMHIVCQSVDAWGRKLAANVCEEMERGHSYVHNFYGFFVREVVSPRSYLLALSPDQKFLSKLCFAAESDEACFRLFLFIICGNAQKAAERENACHLFCNVVIPSYFIAERRASICCAINMIYERVAAESHEFHRVGTILVSAIAVILQKCVSEKDKSGQQIITVLCNLLPTLNQELIELFVSQGVFRLIGSFGKEIPETLAYLLQTLAICFAREPRLLETLNTLGPELFTELEHAKPESVAGVIQSIKLFACCSKEAQVTTIGNRRGLVAGMLIVQNDLASELEFLKWMVSLAENIANIYEMFTAKVPFVILKRMPEIQENEQLRLLYLELYELICSKIFNERVFTETIAMIGKRGYFYPAEFVSVFHRLMCQKDDTQPTSFFRLNRLDGAGIHTGTIQFPADFSLVFSFQVFAPVVKTVNSSNLTPIACYRVKSDNSDMDVQLLYNHNSFACHILKKNKVVCRVVASDVSPEDGQWHNVVLVFKGDKVVIREVLLMFDTITAKAKGLTGLTAIYVGGPATLHIGALSEHAPISKLCFNVSTCYCLSSTSVSKLREIFTRGDRALSANLKDRIICEINPLLVQGNTICRVAPACPTVNFVGRAVSYFNSGKDLLYRISSLKNILPLFTCLSRTCPNCSQVTHHCEVCGALSAKSGSALIVAVMLFMSAVLQRDPSIYNIYDFFALLSELLVDVREKYFVFGDYEVFPSITHFFSEIECLELRREFAEDVLWNFHIPERWCAKSYLLYVVYVLKWCFSVSPESFDFPVASNLPFLLGKVKDAEAREVTDSFLHIFFKKYQFQEDLDYLLLMACESSEEMCKRFCLELVITILSEKPSLMASYEYAEPFLLFLGGPCQFLALKCITVLVTACTAKVSCWDIGYRMAMLLKLESIKDGEVQEYMLLLNQLCFSETNHVKNLRDRGGFIPLLVSFLFQVNDRTVARVWVETMFLPSLTANTVNQICFSANPLWMHWLLMIVAHDSDQVLDQILYALLEIIIRNADINVNVTLVTNLLRYAEIFRPQVGVDIQGVRSPAVCALLDEDNICVPLLEHLLVSIIYDTKYDRTEDTVMMPAQLTRAATPLRLFSSYFKVTRTLKDSLGIPLDLAKRLIRILTLLAQDINVGGVVEDSRVFGSYIIAKTLVFEPEAFTAAANGVMHSLNSAENHTRARCSKLLLDAINTFNIQTSVRTRTAHVLGTEGGPSLIFFGPEYFARPEVVSSIQSWYDALYTWFFAKVLAETRLDEFDNIHLVSRKCAGYFVTDVTANLIERSNLFARKERLRSRSLEVFLRGARTGTGPWCEVSEQQTKRFKACNRISTRGRRVVMFLNHQFVTHEDAAYKRDNRHAPTTEKELVLKYNPTKKKKELRSDDFLFAQEAQRIAIARTYTGILCANNSEMVFTAKEKVTCMPFENIRFIMNRRMRHRDLGIEIYLRSGMSYVFALDEASRRDLYLLLSKLKLKRTEFQLPGKFNFFAKLQECCGAIHQTIPSERLVEETGITTLWRQWRITTYEYLYYLNILGGRSFCDLTQYPIYPWVLIDQDTDVLQLDGCDSYRDLSKSILALSPQVLAVKLRELAAWSKEEKTLSTEIISSQAGVIMSLVRVEPFTTEHILLQSGQFDVSDRQFYSTLDVRDKLGTTGHPRETIPEWYTFPYMFINENHFDLGVRCNGDPVDDVTLPRWAAGPFHYVSVHKRALEMEYASEKMNHWIDLVFGVYRASVEHGNLFPRWAYPESNIYDNLHTEYFGCLPQQLFSSEHPPRGPNPIMASMWNEEMGRSHIGHIMEKEGHRVNACCKGVIFCDNCFYSLNKQTWQDISMTGCGSLWCVSSALNLAVFGFKNNMILSLVNLVNGNVKQHEQPHSPVTCACICGSEYLVTGSSDASLHVYRLPNLKLESLSTHQSNPIIALAANAELGMVASVSEQGIMVLETLIDGYFINSTIVQADLRDVKLAIFKSGTVVVAAYDNVTFFDSRGILIRTLPISDRTRFVCISKYYDYDQREILLATVASQRVAVIDVAKQAIINTYQTNVVNPYIHAVKHSRACIVVGRYADTAEWFSFASSLTTSETT